MGRKPENEMEQIQKGLEGFLDREMGRLPKSRESQANRYAGSEGGRELGCYPEAEGAEPDGYYEDERTEGGRYYGEEAPEPGKYYEGGRARDGRYYGEEAPEPGKYYEGGRAGGGRYYGEEAPEPNEYYEDERTEGGRYYGEEAPEPDEYYEGERSRGRRYYETEPSRLNEYYEGERSRGGRYYENADHDSDEYDEAEYDGETQGRGSGSWKGLGKETYGGRKDGGMKHKEKKKKKSAIGKILFTLVILAAIGLGAIYLLVGVVYGKMRYEEAPSLAGKPVKSNGVTSILLIGSDSRDASAAGRSDAMILLSISNKTRTVHMTSLLRDMYVEIPGHEGNRLNAAYAFGGPELLLETIQANFGIQVNRYVVVNFEAFANLVDAVGGVDLELSSEEVEWVNAYLNEYNLLRNMPIDTDYLDTSLSGLIHLNGAQSLAYSRNRYIGTDFGRTERQRKVLSEVLKRLPAATVKNPKGLVNGLFPNLTTNLTQMECMQIGLQAGKLLTYEIVQDSIPLNGTYSNANIRGMAVLQVDFEKNKEYLRKEIYGEQD